MNFIRKMPHFYFCWIVEICLKEFEIKSLWFTEAKTKVFDRFHFYVLIKDQQYPQFFPNFSHLVGDATAEFYWQHDGVSFCLNDLFSFKHNVVKKWLKFWPFSKSTRRLKVENFAYCMRFWDEINMYESPKVKLQIEIDTFI